MHKRKVVLLLLTIFVLGISAAYADDWHHTWNVGAKPQFEFRSNETGIDISATPGNAVEAYIETKGFHIGPNEVHITEHQEGDRVMLEVHVPNHHIAFFDMTQVKVRVTVPEATALRVNTSDGHIRVDGVKGESRLESGDGSVEATGLDGVLWAHTSDGHIKAQGRFDQLNLSTGDGHIELSVGAGSKLSGTWEIHTKDGSVRAALPADLSADLDADTGDGHIDSDLTITVQGSMNRNHLRGVMNGGGPLFRIHTGDGSIHLSRS